LPAGNQIVLACCCRSSTRGCISLAIPFRIVSMNSSFLQQLKYLGSAKAGWYRGSQSMGTLILGPVLATFVSDHFSFLWGFTLIALLFALMALFGSNVLPGESDKTAPDENSDTAKSSVANHPVADVLQQVRELWHVREVRDSCTMEFVNSAAQQIFTTFILVLALNVAHLPKPLAITLITVQGITTVLASFGLGHLLNLLSSGRLQWLSITLSVAGRYHVELSTSGSGNRAAVRGLSIDRAFQNLAAEQTGRQ